MLTTILHLNQSARKVHCQQPEILPSRWSLQKSTKCNHKPTSWPLHTNTWSQYEINQIERHYRGSSVKCAKSFMVPFTCKILMNWSRIDATITTCLGTDIVMSPLQRLRDSGTLVSIRTLDYPATRQFPSHMGNKEYLISF